MVVRMKVLLAACIAYFLVTAGVAYAAPYTGPIKELVTSHYGREVNLTESGKGLLLEDFCDSSIDTCRTAKESFDQGGFSSPMGVAVRDDPTNPQIFVADTANNRVQQLSAAGTFVSTFGSEVDLTKTQAVKAKEAKGEVPSSSELREENVCTAISKDVCGSGAPGGSAEQMRGDYGIALDQSSGRIFVADLFNSRIDVYTSTGFFIFMVGKDVDETKEDEGAPQAERDVCTFASGDKCKAGVEATVGSSEAGALRMAQGFGNILAVDSSRHIFYVGDEHRVQEFDSETGEWKGEISLVSVSAEENDKVVAIALEETTGNLYVAYRAQGVAHTIREFGPTGAKMGEFQIHNPITSFASVTVNGLAVDLFGRLAVTEQEIGTGNGALFGSIYRGATGHRDTEFDNVGSFGGKGVAFNASGERDELFSAIASGQEIVGYDAVHVAELLTAGEECKTGTDAGSSATFICTLKGQVNPDEVNGTEVWFRWGGTELLGNETARKVVPGGNTLVPVQAVVEGLHPHQTYHYGLTAYDENVHAPEPPLTSENESFTIPSVPPRVLGTPSTPFLHSTSAVLFAELNPENTGTRYTFQYATTAACEGREREAERHVNVDECGGVLETGALESNLYGQIGATLEAVNLQPATGYRYRLVAENEEGEDAAGEEASFTTPPVAALQASTEPAGTLGVTSALLLGQVDPDGVPATYSFEVGVYAGPATQYGIVLSGPTGAGGTLVEKEFLLTGLQPGTKYSYRISISSPGYGSVQGEPVQFTTAGLSEVLPSPTPLAFLPPPPFTFPKVMAPAKCRSGYKLDKHGKCIKKKKRSRKKRKKASHVKVRRARRSSWGAAPGWKEWRG